MKFTCIIDTSSYVNLSKIEIRIGTLLDILSSEVTIRFSSEVNKEITRHWNNNMPSVEQRNRQVHYLRRTKPSVYETRLFDIINDNNKGERNNFISALDLFLKNNNRNLVYLIDDENALRGCLKEVKGSFPIMIFWNSLDVVLYLYFVGNKRKFPFDIAKDALRSLNAEMATDDDRMDPEKTQKRIQKFSLYNTLLERIQKFYGN